MGKSNVNPNHYKIAGRDRQGEDILQARHPQKFAVSQARERFELKRPGFVGGSISWEDGVDGETSTASAVTSSG